MKQLVSGERREARGNETSRTVVFVFPSLAEVDGSRKVSSSDCFPELIQTTGFSGLRVCGESLQAVNSTMLTKTACFP